MELISPFRAILLTNALYIDRLLNEIKAKAV